MANEETKLIENGTITVKFGAWIQKVGEDPTPIEWYLTKLVGTKAQLFSKYVLDYYRIDYPAIISPREKVYELQNTDIIHQIDELMLQYFSDADFNHVLESDIMNKEDYSKNGCLLSLPNGLELLKYPLEVRKTEPTLYGRRSVYRAKEQSIPQMYRKYWTSDIDTRGNAFVVNFDGELEDELLPISNYLGFRPMIWIDLIDCLTDKSVNIEIIKSKRESINSYHFDIRDYL